ncbi:hypothetical protein ABK040_000351 [Willaertia magna]
MTGKLFDVVIIGSGLAGISSAKTIEKLLPNKKILLLEGRDRIGGRTHSICVNDDHLNKEILKVDRSKHWIDCGASWIECYDKNVLYQEAKERDFQVGFSKDWMETSYYDEDGENVTRSRMKIKVSDAWEKSVKYAVLDYTNDKKKKDISLELSMQNYLPNFEFLAAQEDKKGITNRFWNAMRNYAEHYEGTEMENMSTKQYVDCPRLEGESVFFVDTYGQFLRQLASELTNTTIKVSESVCEIKYLEELEQIEVVTRSGLTVTCDYCICTAPLGVLRQKEPTVSSINFTPKLSEEKQEALGHIGFGLLDKVILQFEKRFWGESESGMFFMSENYNNNPIAWSLSYYDDKIVENERKPTLMWFYSGNRAIEMEKKEDEEVINELIAFLQKAYPQHKEEIPKLLIRNPGPLITRWYTDPFSLGSYTHGNTNTTMSVIKKLAKPEFNGRLRFAGEHTSDYFSFAHGAYLSGIREGKKVCGLLQ